MQRSILLQIHHLLRVFHTETNRKRFCLHDKILLLIQHPKRVPRTVTDCKNESGSLDPLLVVDLNKHLSVRFPAVICHTTLKAKPGAARFHRLPHVFDDSGKNIRSDVRFVFVQNLLRRSEFHKGFQNKPVPAGGILDQCI